MTSEHTLQDIDHSIERRLAERRRIDTEIQTLRSARSFLEADHIGDNPAPADNLPKQAKSYSQNLTDAIEEILLAERPLHRKEIMNRVIAKDIYIGTANPLHAIGAYLSLDDRFAFVPGQRGYWTLSDAPPAVASEEVPPPSSPDDALE